MIGQWSQTSTLGLSAQSIADRSGRDYPRDPSDLLRCINYCAGRYSTGELRARMAGKSVQWDRLLAEWDSLAALLAHEMDTRTDGRAERTYLEMKRVLADGTACGVCNATGRGADCEKCKGSGRRGGGKCRAIRCYRGADYCPACRGRGYTTTTERV